LKVIIYSYGLALFARNFVIASDEGAKQSTNWEMGNKKWEMGKRISQPSLASRISPPEFEIASSQAPRNDKLLN